MIDSDGEMKNRNVYCIGIDWDLDYMRNEVRQFLMIENIFGTYLWRKTENYRQIQVILRAEM